MKISFWINCVLIFSISQPLLLAWEKVEGFVDGPNYNNPDQNLILYTNVYQINTVSLPFLFDFRGSGPSDITLSNEVLSLQFDLFEKYDVIRTNISYENIPKEFLDKIADKSIFFRLGYNGNIYAIDNDSKKIILTTKTNEFIRLWTQIPQSNLIAYTIFDNISTNKESEFLLKISNIDGDQITNVINKTIDDLPSGESYWIGDNIFIPSQGRNASIPTLYCINTDKILFSETFHGMPRLLNNKIEVFLWNDQENTQTPWSKIVVFTNTINTSLVDKLSRLNEEVKTSKLKRANPSNEKTLTLTNITKDRLTVAITEPTSHADLIFGLTKRNWMSVLMIAGGTALVVMTLLYAFWPKGKS